MNMKIEKLTPTPERFRGSYQGSRLVYIGLGTLQCYVPTGATSKKVEQIKANRRAYYLKNHPSYKI